MKHARGISVIIPCYNEQLELPKTIDYLMDFLEENFSTYELIIISDGSTDRSAKVVNNIIKFNGWFKTLKLIDYKVNHGKGYAVKQGLLSAKNDLIMILDCDLSVKPENILITLKHYKTTEPFLFIGQRIQAVSQPKYRLFLGWCFRQLTRFVMKFDIKDTQCPYKILNKVDKRYFEQLSIKGFAYDVDLINTVTKYADVVLYTYEVIYYNNDNSSVTFTKTLRMAWDLILIGFMRWK